MVDTATLTRWLRELGNTGLELVERGPETWIVGVQWALTPDEVAAWNAAPDALDGAVDAVAGGFPLVQSTVVRTDDQVVARFWAGVHGEGLSRQAFLLTASSAAKAAKGLAQLTRANQEYAAAVAGREPVAIEERPAAVPTEQMWDFDVVLVHAGDSGPRVADTMQASLGVERAAALDMIRAAPTVIAVGVTSTTAGELARRLEAAGATVSVQPGG
jgi:ribosomal protein L7/L12